MKSYSQAHQDVFALECLDYKRNGIFLDLGCHDPINISNTYLLEKDYGWKGIAIDVDMFQLNKFPSCRSCVAVYGDCTSIDINKLLEDYGINHVDYLSLDLEPASVTLSCLKNLPLDKKTFGVVTFEHDSYRFGNDVRDESRSIFEKYGYHLLCKDISNGGNIYEDWYVHPQFVNIEKVSYLACDSMEHTDLVKRINR